MKSIEEIAAKARQRAKRQNEKAKENWDTVSCRLPKGTKGRIVKLGLTTNGLINAAVLAYLDDLERQTDNLPHGTEKTAEKADTERTELDEKVALMQANDRLHALQEQTRAAKKERETATAADLAKTFIDNCN